MPFLRRFTGLQSINTLLQIEGVVIEEIIPTILRLLTGGFAVNIGEWLKGTYNVTTQIASDDDLSPFGKYLQVAAGENDIIPDNGNGFIAISGKPFRQLAIVRVDMRVGALTQVDVGTVDVELNNPTAADITVTMPAGTRIGTAAAVPTSAELFAVDQDTVFVVPALGSQIKTVNVFTVKKTGALVLAATGLFVESGFATAVGLTATSPVPTHTQLTHLTADTIVSRYTTALAATLGSTNPNASIVVTWAARTEDVAGQTDDIGIRRALVTNAATASANGRGRIPVVRPPVGTTKAVAIAAATIGVGALRDERQVYAYPHVTQFIPEAASTRTVGFDAAVVVLMNNLEPFENVGQTTSLLTWITAFEGGIGADNFVMADYIAFKAAGVCAARFDPDIGRWVAQSDATTDLTLTNLKRRRTADFIGDSLALIDAQFTKQLMTLDRRQSRATLWHEFFEGLLSKENPPAQKIAAFFIDERSGNTQVRLDKGIHTLKAQVKTLPSFDVLDIQIEVGEEVDVQTS
jgi:hypothetical protein